MAFGVVQGSSRLRGSDEKFALKCDDWVSSPSSDLSDENSRIRALPFFFFPFSFITNKLNIYYKKNYFQTSLQSFSVPVIPIRTNLEENQGNEMQEREEEHQEEKC